MAKEKKVRILNESQVEITILPHEGLKGGERIKHPTAEQMGWDTVEMSIAWIDPGEGYTAGVSTGGKLDGVQFGLENAFDEVLYCIRGELTFYWGEKEKTTVRPGDFFFLPKGTNLHKAVNEGAEQFFCVAAMYSPDYQHNIKEHKQKI
ncbi:cupin domain-containing protein [Chloroflexota bacterium]